MDKLHPLNSLMIVFFIEVNKSMFHPKKENEEVFSPKVPYLNAIGTLINLANGT